MLTLLTVDECTGLDCPLLSLPYFLVLYLILMIFTCCCCYPGACLCPQRQARRDSLTGKPKDGQLPWHTKLNLLGSIGSILTNEWPAEQVLEPIEESGDNEDEDDKDDIERKRRWTMLKRRKRIRY